MALIKTVLPQEAEGKLKEIYDDLIQSRGKIADVHTIQSLNPESIVAHMELYMCLMFGSSPLKRYQREMIGIVVSRANDCKYCQIHHAEALQHYWKDEKLVKKFRKDYTTIELNETDRRLCDYAWKLTKKPHKATDGKFIKPLHKIAMDDRAILDATMIIGYFNFVNRIVQSLGVELEEDPTGFKY